jgi:AraC-like DNA-binding protein
MQVSFLQLIGTFQGILLSVFFFLKSRHRLSNLMLGLYVFLFSVGLLEDWFVQNSDTSGKRIIAFLISNSAYLYGPLLYLFIYYLTTSAYHFNKKHFLHFAPFFIFFSTDLVTFLSGWQPDKFSSDILEIVGFELLVIQILIYNMLSIRRLTKYHAEMLETYSNIEERDLRWLKRLLVIITCIYIFSFALSHLSLFGVQGLGKYFGFIQVMITLCIYLISYNVLARPGLFLPETGFPAEKEMETATRNNEDELKPGNRVQENMLNIEKPIQETESLLVSKYRKSGLKPEHAKKLLTDLQKIMEEEKLFKQPELNIHSLASIMNISKNHLTQVINEQLQINFFEFINTYRVEEAKKILVNPDYSHLNLQGIAAEAGYKSKTTFFINFKKLTGFSPLEWSKQAGNS